jgi:hypothetical protein
MGCWPPVSFSKTSKMSLQYTIKIKVDLNIDDSQRHYTSRKKLDFTEPGHSPPQSQLYRIVGIM